MSLKHQLIAAAREAGAVILRIYDSDFHIGRKSDLSPVTEADVAAESVILAALEKLAPGTPVIAEEACAARGIPTQAPDRFFLVDPLDGTKEFVARNGEFTVNIALIENGRPVAGVVFLPAFDTLYVAENAQAERWQGTRGPEPIVARIAPAKGMTMAISRSHADKELVKVEQLGIRVADTIVAGSSLKFCRIAEGAADVYPRFGTTMEWDTAAGQAVLEAAGGRVETVDRQPLHYGKPGFRNPHFIAYGRRDTARQ